MEKQVPQKQTWLTIDASDSIRAFLSSAVYMLHHRGFLFCIYYEAQESNRLQIGLTNGRAEFESSQVHYINLLANTLGKGMKTCLLPAQAIAGQIG